MQCCSVSHLLSLLHTHTHTHIHTSIHTSLQLYTYQQSSWTERHPGSGSTSANPSFCSSLCCHGHEVALRLPWSARSPWYGGTGRSSGRSLLHCDGSWWKICFSPVSDKKQPAITWPMTSKSSSSWVRSAIWQWHCSQVIYSDEQGVLFLLYCTSNNFFSIETLTIGLVHMTLEQKINHRRWSISHHLISLTKSFQSAALVITLVRNIPMLIADKIPEGDTNWWTLRATLYQTLSTCRGKVTVVQPVVSNFYNET